MKQQTIDLSQIYLKPLTSSIHSFIKAVGTGTGLGKTYSSVPVFVKVVVTVFSIKLLVAYQFLFQGSASLTQPVRNF